MTFFNQVKSTLKVLAASTLLFGLTAPVLAKDARQVAYLSASSANTWLGASVAAMQKVAKANNITLTEFDAQFDPARQTKQMQDAIAAGTYDGIVLVTINGPGAIPDVETAIKAGIQVVVLNQVVGADLTTSEPQVKGVAASVLAAPFRTGERYAALTLKACEGIDPCEVVYITGIKGIPLDEALRAGFDSVINKHANITVVAEGEGKYLGPDGGITATQDILQVKGDFDVMVGSDQSMQGAAIVLKEEGLIDKVKLIGFGGSTPALNGIKDGTWFGTVFAVPAGEGRMAMEAMVDALDNGKHQGGIDSLRGVPHEGLVTKENVNDFTAEWDG